VTQSAHRAARRRASACLALLGAAALACGVQADHAEASISPAQLAARIDAGDAPLIVDVRTSAEYSAGHIPGAINVPVDELDARFDALAVAPDEEIVVHCQSGRRASAAERALREAGYTHVVDLDGSMQAWKAAGLPVESGAGAD